MSCPAPPSTSPSSPSSPWEMLDVEAECSSEAASPTSGVQEQPGGAAEADSSLPSQLLQMTIDTSMQDETMDERDAAHRSSGGAVPSASAPSAPQLSASEVAALLSRLPQLAAQLHSDEETAQIEAAILFRRLLSIEPNPPIQQVIDCGVVPRLVHCLSASHSPVLQFESAWALTNIASGTSKHTRMVVGHGAIPVFVALLDSPNDDVKEQAVWALGNIAGSSVELRDQVLHAGALQPLLRLCTPDAKPILLRNSAWCLANLCRGKPQPDLALVRPALPVLARLVQVLDDQVLADACCALSYLSYDRDPQNQKIEAVLESGVAQRMVELLTHPNSEVQTPALRTVGNTVVGDNLQTQVILNAGALQGLLPLLAHPNKLIRKESCRALSNITAGTPGQIQQVIDANLIPPLVSMLRNEVFDVQKEAAWAISNATSGSDQQIRYLASQGVLASLCELFRCMDPKIIMVTLQGVERILRVGKADAANDPQGVNQYAAMVNACGGRGHLEQLQHRDNEVVCKKAVSILQAYFVEHGEGARGEAPSAQRAADHSQSLQPLINSLRNATPVVQKEALGALKHAMCGASDQLLRSAVGLGAVPLLCECLTSTTPEVAHMAVEALGPLLQLRDSAGSAITGAVGQFCIAVVKDCGGMGALHRLLQSNHADTALKASALLLRFF